jgi:phosphotransferase system enzyme I (PtsP)
VLGRVRDARRQISDGDLIMLDAAQGAAFVRPTTPMVEAFDARLELGQKRRAEFAAMRDLPSDTIDGTRITLMVNAGLRDDVAALDTTGADGIGLFRTEFEFLIAAELPKRERQQRIYRDVMEAAGDKPVIFRTVDIGGDKTLPYMHSDSEDEENPAMGWRAIRLALERDALMKAQAEALIGAAAGRILHVMFPMVSEPWEYEEARALFEKQHAVVARKGKPLPLGIRYGAMLEVPALAESLDMLLPRLDFLSIGTNDLTQFLFAADRAHPKLAERYDWLSPAILRFLARVVTQVRAADVPIGVCGEMGGRTLEAMALIGLGIDRLSITPAAIGPVKAMVRSLDAEALRQAMPGWLKMPLRSLRPTLQQWADDNGVRIV